MSKKLPTKNNWYWTKAYNNGPWIPRWWSGINWSLPASELHTAKTAAFKAKFASNFKNEEIYWKEIE